MTRGLTVCGVLLLCLAVSHSWEIKTHKKFRKPHHDENYHYLIRKYVMMIVGGRFEDTDNSFVELFDFKTNTSCYAKAQLPHSIDELEGGYVNHRPMVCGGTNGTHDDWSYVNDVTDFCYALDHRKQMWMPVQTMIEKRAHAASVVLHDGHTWWMAGGERRQGYVSIEVDDPLHRRHYWNWNSEIFTEHNYWTRGPVLQTPRVGACAVNINENETAIIGGTDDRDYTYEYQMDIQIYNWNTMTWREGPLLNMSRYHPGCGVIWSERVTGNPIVYIFGGNASPAEMTYEIWDTITNSIVTRYWGSDDLYEAIVVELAGEYLAVVEGDDDDVYLVGVDGMTKIGETIAPDREYGGTGFLVPRHFTECGEEPMDSGPF